MQGPHSGDFEVVHMIKSQKVFNTQKVRLNVRLLSSYYKQAAAEVETTCEDSVD